MYTGLHFRADEPTRKSIEMLADKLDCSYGEIARRAVRLFNHLYDEVQSGGDVVIRNGKSEKSLLIMWKIRKSF